MSMIFDANEKLWLAGWLAGWLVCLHIWCIYTYIRNGIQAKKKPKRREFVKTLHADASDIHINITLYVLYMYITHQIFFLSFSRQTRFFGWWWFLIFVSLAPNVKRSSCVTTSLRTQMRIVLLLLTINIHIYLLNKSLDTCQHMTKWMRIVQ